MLDIVGVKEAQPIYRGQHSNKRVVNDQSTKSLGQTSRLLQCSRLNQCKMCRSGCRPHSEFLVDLDSDWHHVMGKIHMLNPNTSYDGLGSQNFGRWFRVRSGHEGGPCDGISVLLRRGRDTRARRSLSLSVGRGHSELAAVCKPWNPVGQHLNLGFPVCRDKCLWFKSPICSVLLWPPELTRTHHILFEVTAKWLQLMGQAAPRSRVTDKPCPPKSALCHVYLTFYVMDNRGKEMEAPLVWSSRPSLFIPYT